MNIYQLILRVKWFVRFRILALTGGDLDEYKTKEYRKMLCSQHKFFLRLIEAHERSCNSVNPSKVDKALLKIVNEIIEATNEIISGIDNRGHEFLGTDKHHRKVKSIATATKELDNY